MARYNNSDLKLSEDWDLVIENGDLALVHNIEFIKQSVRNRIKINDPDWFDYIEKEIGANMEDLMGKPNTIDTAREGIEKIATCLTRNGLIDREELYIRPVPTSKFVIEFFVFIQINENINPIGFVVTFNLESGVEIRGV